MKCPFCGCRESKVVDSRPTDDGDTIRRRRECESCEKRFTTYEKIENIPIMVIKKDGRREAFDSSKIMNGLLKACEKRPVPVDKMEDIVQDIEKRVYNSLKKEITSNQIGELVMQRLKDLDEVAYVRFASVYRQFKDINTFMGELEKLIKENNGG
ncbi:MAG: transcriptional regulator NrdR [Clostridia bacterium]|nr:transcriptional regulator NrdR [Clostridia bacterium]